jgi:hypothetical protein
MTRAIQLFTDEELEQRQRAREAAQMELFAAQSEARKERLDWIKARALEYLDRDADCRGALASFTSDCNKEWSGVPGKVVDFYSGVGSTLFMLGMMHAGNHDVPQMRHWVEGFN